MTSFALHGLFRLSSLENAFNFNRSNSSFATFCGPIRFPIPLDTLTVSFLSKEQGGPENVCLDESEEDTKNKECRDRECNFLCDFFHRERCAWHHGEGQA